MYYSIQLYNVCTLHYCTTKYEYSNARPHAQTMEDDGQPTPTGALTLSGLERGGGKGYAYASAAAAIRSWPPRSAAHTEAPRQHGAAAIPLLSVTRARRNPLTLCTMSYPGYGGSSGAGPATPGTPPNRTVSSIMPPHVSSMTLPMSPRSSVPGYIRRASNMSPATATASSSSSSSSMHGGAMGSPRAPAASASLSSLRSSTNPTTPSSASTIGVQYLPSMLGGPSSSSAGSAGAAATSAGIAGSAAGQAAEGQQAGAFAQGPDILERPRDRTRNSEVSASSLAFLFAEVVSYTQNRVLGISDLERKCVN